MFYINVEYLKVFTYFYFLNLYSIRSLSKKGFVILKEKDFKYNAFISYSHQDEKFGKWLHKSLEGYKIPKELYIKYSDLPKKLYPIFRDREELPTSSSLSQNINEAIKASRYLIVICSPNAAKSKWVNQEIIDFKRLYGENQILAIILDGEPNATNKEIFDDNLECFPKALRYMVNSDGVLIEKETEPIASDVRDGKDEKRFGLLKLIAGLLGVKFDELYQREEKRRKRTRIIWMSIALVIVAVFALLALFSFEQRKIAEDELVKANHNIGLVFLEKAKDSLAKKNISKAHFYAYSALEKLSDKFDSIRAKAKARSIIYSNPYTKLVLNKEIKNIAPFEYINFSLDEKTFKTISANNIIRSWDVASGKLLKTQKGNIDIALDFAISDDGQTAVSASLRNKVILYDIKNNFFKTLASGHFFTSVAISGDGETIVAGANDNTIMIWGGKENRKLLNTLITGHTQGGTSVAISKDGEIIVSGSHDHTIKIWDKESGKLLNTLVGHNKSVTDVDISKIGKIIVSTSYDKTIKIWDITSGELLETLNADKFDVASVAIAKDGKTIISCSNDGMIKIWYKERENLLNTLEFTKKEYNKLSNNSINTHKDGISSVVISEDGNFIVSGMHGTIKIWDKVSGKLLNVLKHSEKDGLTSVALSNSGKTIVSAMYDSVKIWNKEDGKLLNTLSFTNKGQKKSLKNLVFLRNNTPITVAISGDGKTIIAAFDSIVKIWDKVNSQLIGTFKAGHSQGDNGTSIAISKDGRTIVSGVHSTIKVWNKENRKLLNTINTKTGWISSIAITKDGETIVSGSSGMGSPSSVIDSSIRIWDRDTGKLLNTLKGHKVGVTSVAISNDEKTIISGSFDNTIRIWDKDSGRLLNILTGLKDTVTCVNISGDKKTIVSSTSDNFIKIWDIDKRNIEKQIKDLEQQFQVELKGINVADKNIPYKKLKWSENHQYHWLEHALNGDSEAMYYLGLIYDRRGDNKKALTWYKKSFQKGYAPAKERMEFIEKWIQNNDNKTL